MHHTQVYILAKFQLHIQRTLKLQHYKVAAINRKIDLCSKYGEKELQVLTKTDVTSE